ncbi:Heat shock protein HslJ [Lutibacter oricola]|uniref:Heat shock protein HslJ n=1 Tax=Lutibacter oricola TaxID=762486 RepID=A0A1H3BMM6_9FLAO|nr:META domain-containing protein [Lutibacter oricola]SDX43232.1 Heat shock protein HslJ [Lutibacter oricola]
MKQFKLTPYALAIFLLMSCGTKKTNATYVINKKTEAKQLLNDIWILDSIDNLTINNTAQKKPQLEVNIKENKFYGNDSCNQIKGSITKLTNSEIQFKHIFGTKMRCNNMKFTEQYHSKLLKTKYYTIDKLQLSLLDSEENILLTFRKID